MDALLLAISPNDPLWIAIAFAFGYAVKQISLPPLIGYLIAGFVLNALGAESDSFLDTVADLGITLLLFTIGLKLRLRALFKPEVWGVASIHLVVVSLLFAGFVLMLSAIGLPMFTDLDAQTSLLVGFVLSFSSTVFAIKVLDELGATTSKHGQVAIGVLVIQDIAAVIFLAFSAGKVPTVWALGLLLLIPLRPLLYRLLEKVGHGELLLLFGIVLALVGADVFEMVGIKGDVGALILGMILATHHKASELAKSLLSLKDLFLIGFFLSIGMTALPGWAEIGVAVLLLLLLPVKTLLYYLLFNQFHARASTSWRASTNLANYSEFGLIVGAIAVSAGWLNPSWMAVFAIALSASFIISAPVIRIRDQLFQRWRPTLIRWERKSRLPDEQDIDLSAITTVIFGMGRMGTAAYTAIEPDYTGELVGIEINEFKAEEHCALGRNVVVGDGTNPEFWFRAIGLLDNLNRVMLTLPTHEANLAAARQLKSMGYTGFIAATSKFEDEEQALKEAGVSFTFNIYTEAGLGFAEDLRQLSQP
ncbi:cation:proton antiporter [Reinekea blandensis]|uniref:cation:proton antiporter domain-containing protein n=1 Tax=Reinekea blandensis TaxID=374838 RepID=UPI0002F33CF6|nr:cation:proton antiporter [Reinekea blandensis]